MTTNSESTQSGFLEKLREYAFLSDILKEAWFKRHLTVDILRAEVDSAGYDLALECGGTLRYIQLKSSKSDAKTSRQTVNAKLSDKPGGCIIWIFQDGQSGHQEYRFFGGGPAEKPNLGTTPGRHSKGDAQGFKAERPNTRVISKSQFAEMDSIGKLFDELFPES